MDNRGFGINEILRLEKLGCIYKVEERPYIVMPLTVVYSTKWRLVVDASRNLNDFLEVRHVKLENLEQAEFSVQEGDFQTISDLDSGYWHVGIHQEFQKYLGIHYVDEKGVNHF